MIIMISLMMTVKMMRMIIFATLRGDRPEAGAGNPLIGQIGDQDITGLDRAVRHDHRHQGHYNHRDDLPPWLDRTVSSKTTISVMIIFVFKIINRATMRREENRDLKKGQPVTEGKHTRKTTNHEIFNLIFLASKNEKNLYKI